MDRQMKKARKEDEDLISTLPDDLIHRIMLFMDTRFAVQTCVLSKRWKFIWTTLPYLSFDGNEHGYKNISKFLDQFFSLRNGESPIIKLEICPGNGVVRTIKKYVERAILHNLESLHVESDRFRTLSAFRSKTLKELNLTMKYLRAVESHRVSLPSLTTLLLKCCNKKKCPKFPESILTTLPALRTLGLNHFELPNFFSLPDLTALRLESCTLPQQIWDFPALLNLKLTNVVFPENMSDYFLALPSLQSLAIDFGGQNIGCCVVSSPELLNLEIRVSLYTADLKKGKVVVLAPKLHNFSATGFFLTSFEGSELENVNIRFWDCIDDTPSLSESKNNLISFMLLRYQTHLKIMFSQLRSAKILTLDLLTLQALSRIFYILQHFPCPFYNLKYLKIPHGYEESRMSRYVIRYLHSGSSSATIVRTLSQNNLTPQMEPTVSSITQNGVREEPLLTATTVEVVDYQSPYKHIYFQIIDMRVPKENPAENSVLVANKVTQAEAPVSGASNDREDSSENSNFVKWQGHEVNSECVGMLDLIMKKYPSTFKDLPKRNEKLLTVKLNTLSSSVNAFIKMSMAEVDTEMITEFRALFIHLRLWGFNTNWLLRHILYIERLHEVNASDSRIDNAKSKLQELQTLRAEKSTDSESFRTKGSSHASPAGYVGDGLL